MEKVLCNNGFDAASTKLTVNDLVEVKTDRLMTIWKVSRPGAILNRQDIASDDVIVYGDVVPLSLEVCQGRSAGERIIVVYGIPSVKSFKLLSDQELTQDGSSDIIFAKYYNYVSLGSVVSSVSGTSPSLVLSVVGVDEFGNERILVTSSAINSAGVYWLDAELGVFETFKVVWHVSGESPSFTVSVFVGLRYRK